MHTPDHYTSSLIKFLDYDGLVLCQCYLYLRQNCVFIDPPAWQSVPFHLTFFCFVLLAHCWVEPKFSSSLNDFQQQSLAEGIPVVVSCYFIHLLLYVECHSPWSPSIRLQGSFCRTGYQYWGVEKPGSECVDFSHYPHYKGGGYWRLFFITGSYFLFYIKDVGRKELQETAH